jgi:anaerobic magnesium-protoporphyrin IX monomethyl ester cyclase
LKILLIYPYCLDERPQDDDVRPVPIGVYYIGALLREHGFHVEILNWYNINKTPGLIKKNLLKHHPDVIGFSILHANRCGGIDIARQAKKLNPRVKIVFGGIGATFLWSELLASHRFIDFIVTGEGEYSFLRLVRQLQQRVEDDAGLKAIPGLAYREKGRNVLNDEAEAITDIDRLPNPARYFTYQHVISSRGCPYNCTFCGSPRFWKRRVRFHSPAYFVEQLELLSDRGVSSFYVSDDTFTLKKERVIDICRLILDKGLPITWMAISRVNCIDAEILYWMRKAGCIQISFGVESGSRRIRDFLNKKIETADIVRAFALTRSYGILPRAYFIYGSPGETWETIQESVDLMHMIKPLDMASYILDIYPGTALYAMYQEKTGHGDDIWRRKIEDIMYFETDSALSAETVLAFGEKLRSEFYGNLHRFAAGIELVDDRDLYREHADFCSRLGLTFSHGHFARIDAVRSKEETAAALFARALQYHADQRAYLGLAIIQQKNREFSKAAATAAEGIRHFPASEELHICQAISYLNLGRFQQALTALEGCRGSPAAAPYIKECRRRLDQEER